MRIYRSVLYGLLLAAAALFGEDRVLYNAGTEALLEGDPQRALALFDGITSQAYQSILFRRRLAHNRSLALEALDRGDQARFERREAGLDFDPQVPSALPASLEWAVETLKMHPISPQGEQELLTRFSKLPEAWLSEQLASKDPFLFVQALVLAVPIENSIDLEKRSESFYSLVREWQKDKAYCLCQPWDQVIPLFEQGRQYMLLGEKEEARQLWLQVAALLTSEPRSYQVESNNSVEQELLQMQNRDTPEGKPAAPLSSKDDAI